MNKHEYMLQKAKQLRKDLTDVEKIFWYNIRNKKLGYKFVRQYIFDDKYILDFYCAEKKIVIELDGGQHNENTKDIERDLYLKNRGCTIIRFWNNEVLNNLNGCLTVLLKYLE